MLGKQPHGFVSQFQREAANPMAGTENVVAGALALLFNLADHGIHVLCHLLFSLPPEAGFLVG